MNNTITHIDSRGWITALTVTLTIHIAMAAGIIWGGWMEAHLTGFKPRPGEVLVTVDMSKTSPLQPKSARIPEKQKEESAPEPKQPKLIQKPNIFIPVNQETTTPHPPENNTPFYSNANTKAGNKQPEKKYQQQPFIDGENKLFPGMLNNNDSSPNPIQKSATQPAQAATAPRPIPRAQLERRESAKIPHDLVPLEQAHTHQTREPHASLPETIQPNDALAGTVPFQDRIANNSLVPALPEGPEKASAPTITEQRRRLEAGMLASRKMKQEGGNARFGAATLDVRLTGYGEYDARFVQAVRLAWLRFRDKAGWFHPGKVVIDFKLHHDGTISKLSVQQNVATAVQAYYCKEALAGPAPFEKWTEAMRREIGADARSCRFSFHYLFR